MTHVLVTGATGFLGGAVVATLLARGLSVVAVSRSDPDGARTEASVLDAASGFGFDIGERVRARLTVVDAGDGGLSEALDADSLRNVNAVWHCAAEMSYSTKKLVQAFQTNICGTADLYKKVAALAPACQRFYYVSTAYTAGMRGGDTEEALHVGNSCINTYQITKWCAEQTLHVLHDRSPVPITIFRPTVVVGHSHTGWTRRNGFGLYMFVDAIEAVSRTGAREVRMDIGIEGHLDVLPIDRLVDDIVGLTLRADPGREFEIFQCANGHVSMRQIVSTIGEVLGVQVSFGAPQTVLDQKVDRAIAPNRPFANGKWDFRRARLDAALGAIGERHAPVSPALIRKLVTWYRAEADANVEMAAA